MTGSFNIVLRSHNTGVRVRSTQLTGVGVILGGVGILTYNATILWHAAYSLNAQFAELAGWAAVGVLVFECLGLSVASHLWGDRKRVMALAAVLVTAAAGIYTLRLEMKFQIGGQADQLEQREALLADNQQVEKELETQRATRDRLTAKKQRSESEEETLEYSRRRIQELENRWRARIVTAGASPEAGWLARQAGGSERGWEDALQALPLAFWGLVRMFVLPLGLALLATGARGASSPALRRTGSDDEREGEADPASAVAVSPPPPINVPALIENKPRLGIRVQRRGDVGLFIRQMIEQSDGAVLRSLHAFEAYRAWCTRRGEDHEPHSQFGVLFCKATGIDPKRGPRGASYYFGVQMKEAGQAAA